MAFWLRVPSLAMILMSFCTFFSARSRVVICRSKARTWRRYVTNNDGDDGDDGKKLR